MKLKFNLFLLGALLFVLLTSMKTMAPQPVSKDLKVEITNLEDLRVQLSAQNETGKKLYLSVLLVEANAFHGTTETEIFTEAVSGEVSNYHRTLNLSKLESGSYRISVKAGKNRFERLLNIRAKEIVDPNKTRVITIE